jgi:hypothetical protein
MNKKRHENTGGNEQEGGMRGQEEMNKKEA